MYSEASVCFSAPSPHHLVSGLCSLWARPHYSHEITHDQENEQFGREAARRIREHDPLDADRGVLCASDVDGSYGWAYPPITRAAF